MGLETMRRLPAFLVFAFCLLLCVSLLSSWSSESELHTTMKELEIQLQECGRKEASCVEENLSKAEQNDGYTRKLAQLDNEKAQLKTIASEAKQKALEMEGKFNRSQVEIGLLKTELQKLTALEASESIKIDTLHSEKETLKSEVAEHQRRIEELEKVIAKPKALVGAKTPPNMLPPSKITPAPSPAKLNADSVLGAPINQPLIENNAKEDTEDLNTINDNNFNDFDGNEK